MKNFKAIESRQARKASKMIPGASQRERYGKAGRAVEKPLAERKEKK